MTKKELADVETGDKILHKRYGECIVQKFQYGNFGFFGLIVKPTTSEGDILLHLDSGAPNGTPLLEHSLLQLRPLSRPFREENYYLVQVRKMIKRPQGEIEKTDGVAYAT
jgi:hypothetical protein